MFYTWHFIWHLIFQTNVTFIQTKQLTVQSYLDLVLMELAFCQYKVWATSVANATIACGLGPLV